MNTAGEFRTEAGRLRDLLKDVTDPEALKAIQDLIDELDARAREMDRRGAPWRIEYGRIRKLGGGDYWKGQRLEDEAPRSKMSPYALGLVDHRSMREGIARGDTSRPVFCPFDDGTPEKAEYDRGWDALPLRP